MYLELFGNRAQTVPLHPHKRLFFRGPVGRETQNSKETARTLSAVTPLVSTPSHSGAIQSNDFQQHGEKGEVNKT